VFDFRYHVASLLAVFIALVIGILVGVGLSGRGFVSDAERKNLEERIDELSHDRDAARRQLSDLTGRQADLTRRQAATDDFAAAAFPPLAQDRLHGVRVAVVFLGSTDSIVDSAITQAVKAGGGRVIRRRALRLPLDVAGSGRVLGRRPLLQPYAGADHARDLGRDLGRELVAGGETPILDALNDLLVEERDGSARPTADAIVVCRTVPPQEGATQQFLTGLYGAMARAGVPAVGVERAAPPVSAIPAYIRGGLSTVDSVDTAAGRLALVLELAGAQPGHYGVDESATSGILPPLQTVSGR
jgi:Copper transport outer membrane protein, MctB